MPFVFAIIGIVLLVSGVRDSSNDLLTLVKGDFTGSDNFSYWVISILVLGGIGYIKDLQSFSRALLILVIIVLVLDANKNGSGGFFTKFQSGISGITGG